MTSGAPILVIGGGISGLVCAWRLKQKGLSVRLLERSSRFGGVIDAIRQDGFLFDIGPQSFLADREFLELIDSLGLAPELLEADPRAPRYILLGGHLVPAPFAPPLLLLTPLFGARTKFRLLTEAFRRSYPPDGDESIAAFVRRKFGQDLLTNLVAPFVSGVYAGDPESLSFRSAFPTVHEMESRHGSVIRGAIKMRRKPAGPRPRLSNFRHGITALIEALAGKLGASAESRAQITSIRRMPPEIAPRFEVSCNIAGASQTLPAAAIVIATPAAEAASLLAPIQPGFAGPLAKIEYARVAQVGAGYRLEQIGRAKNRPLYGFGFLVPRTEGLRLLGTVWSSSLFPNRAPESMATFTSFLGGATDPEICSWSEDRIAEIAHKELAGVIGIAGPPVSQHVARWERAIPQYNLGHGQIVASLENLCASTQGVFLAGNYLSGPSLPACIKQATKVAESAAHFSLKR